MGGKEERKSVWLKRTLFGLGRKFRKDKSPKEEKGKKRDRRIKTNRLGTKKELAGNGHHHH